MHGGKRLNCLEALIVTRPQGGTSPIKALLWRYYEWQTELSFKELKSTLGFHQYRFQHFECVEAWVEMALTTFLYLEWHRAGQLTRRGSEKEKAWWRSQRTYGLCQAVRQASQQAELKYLADRLETPGGLQKLKRLILTSFPSEYRAAL